MNRKQDIVLGLSGLLVAGLVWGVYSGGIPLGIAGEWQWPRIGARPGVLSLILAAFGVVAYGAYAALGFRALGVPSRLGLREAGWVAGLTAAAIAVQVFIPMGAPDEYDLTKWAYVHYFRGSTGYYEIAKQQAMPDPWKFMADYPTWIKSQDPYHIGTHPPGIIAAHCVLLSAMERHRGMADAFNAAMPPSMLGAFRQLEAMNKVTIPYADRAEIYLVSLLTLVACAGAVAPIYLLARESLPPQLAWAAAAFWPLAPALNLFQPLTDAAYPGIAATALAAAAWAARLRGTPGWSTWASAALGMSSGAVMAFGMMFTLAFLPVGLTAALIVLSTRSITWLKRGQVIVWIGVGFLASVGAAWYATGADPFLVWRWNLHHHARFYEEMHRSYLPWLIVNPIELAISAGLPAVVWCLTGVIGDRRYVPRAFWSGLAVLALANLSGRNLGEVARLWMLFLPPLFTAVGVGLTRLGGGGQAIFVTVLLTGFQTLALQSLVQLVYPF